MGSKMSSARRTSEGTFKRVETNRPDSPNSMDSPAKSELLQGSARNSGGGRHAHEFEDGGGDDSAGLSAADAGDHES
eukprot:CAMPEP_0205911332 /NCGR_PEP_ID=MMETSP1325-20131115/5080_1 /ASSEMBLY_ACC=CAM_ASM_000708 /TAXON_ID=236786 /ORGANISM="Florenciella sp., Strain RCC1007" /LENGTH=76 /DNA_ID=CAMNT_0053277847 /DNA_START=102 /DNA_END=332 /DNA_ORIENTATION=-